MNSINELKECYYCKQFKNIIGYNCADKSLNVNSKIKYYCYDCLENIIQLQEKRIKLCVICDKEKPLEDYSPGRKCCKKCYNKRTEDLRKRRGYKRPRILNRAPETDLKECSECKQIKQLSEFYLHNSSNKHHGKCKKCTLLKSAEYSKNKPIELKIIQLERNRESYKRNRNNPDFIRKELFRSAKSRSKDKNIEFNLKLEDIIVPEYCPILGIKLIRGIGSDNGPIDSSPTLDRIDSNLGYIKGNVCVISYRANTIKNCGTAEEHEKVAQWIRKMLTN